jgi:hypothetical protein
MRTGDDRSILEREIAVIKELLEEQPDSKCTDDMIKFAQREVLLGLLISQGVWNHLCITKAYCCSAIQCHQKI